MPDKFTNFDQRELSVMRYALGYYAKALGQSIADTENWSNQRVIKRVQAAYQKDRDLLASLIQEIDERRDP